MTGRITPGTLNFVQHVFIPQRNSKQHYELKQDSNTENKPFGCIYCIKDRTIYNQERL